MEEIKAALLSGDGRQIMPPTLIEQVRNLNAQLLSLSTGLSSLQDIIKKISESGFNVIDDAGNVGMKYDENGLDVAAISSHMQGLIKSIEGLGLELGETSATAYAGDKGKANATAIASLIESLGTLQNNLSSLTTSNSGAHTTFSTAISALQALIRQIAENGFNVIDANGNVGMKYDDNGLDAALLSSHFQGLINSLISTLITAAKGSTLAPLVNSLIPATYLPSYVDDVIDIDIFGTSAIAQYSSDNDGNTNVLPDKLCYDDENKVFVTAHQTNNAIDLIAAGSPESGKIYLDITANVSYRWSGTTMAEISNSISLGETTNTAYAGDKGKANADNISRHTTLITALSTITATLSSLLTQVSENGYYISDASGNVAMKYDASGFDVALLSDHIKSLIRQIDGIAGGVQLGETTGTAYDGGKGSALNTLVNKLNLAVNTLKSLVNSCNEEGYYVTDSAGNVVMKYTLSGLDVAEISTHLQALLAEYFATKDEYSMLSTNVYDGLLSIYHDRKVRLALPSTAKILLYGDSISSTDYTFYKDWMIYYSGLSDVYNGGFSGRTAAYIASDAALARIFNYDPDVIIFQTGGNDVGDVVGTFGAVPSETTVSETDISVDYNGTYFIQAVSHIIRKVKAHYYNIVTRAALTGTETASEKIAKINAVKKPYIAFMTPTPQKRNGGDLTWSSEANWIRKRNAIVECCNKYNVHCIDIYSLWGVDMSLEPEWTSPTDQINQNGIYTMDGLHPSQAGYQRISELINGEINITIKS